MIMRMFMTFLLHITVENLNEDHEDNININVYIYI